MTEFMRILAEGTRRNGTGPVAPAGDLIRTGSEKMLILAFLASFLSVSAYGGDSKAVRLIRTIPLTDVQGRIDHLDLDRSSGRLFVAALGNNSVEVIDVKTGNRVHRIRGLREPQGVLAVPDRNLLFVTNAGDGTVRVYDSRTWEPVKTIQFSEDADNLRYDRERNIVYVGYGNGALGIIDIERLERAGDISLSGHPESFEVEAHGKRIFVNVPRGSVAIVDRNKKTVPAHWPVPGGCGNFPMALDEAGRRLFIGCRNPDKIVVYDIEAGRPVSEIAIAGDADDIFFDDARKRIYVSCGAGVLQVFERIDTGNYRATASILTSRGARTSLFDREQAVLFLAVPRGPRHEAEIRMYSVQPAIP